MDYDLWKEALRTVIFEHRTVRGISHERMAAALNVTRTAISHKENGTVEYSMHDVWRLAPLFGVTVDALMRQVAERANGR